MHPISVLLVDDNPTFLRIATRFLRGYCGDQVSVAGVAVSGEDALARARELHPQAVLLDLNMPGMSGLEALPRLREILPEAGIVALTMMDATGYRRAALNAGADDFVPKSLINTDLLPAIRRAVRTREKRRRE